jgi:hypothetical protein
MTTRPSRRAGCFPLACNLMIGNAQDDPARLLAGVEYLLRRGKDPAPVLAWAGDFLYQYGYQVREAPGGHE